MTSDCCPSLRVPGLCVCVILTTVLTSRMSNLAVLTLLQVFLRRDTGLMFIPAVRWTEERERQTRIDGKRERERETGQ